MVIRKPLSKRQTFVLLSVGILVGYPSLVTAGHCAWAGDCPNPMILMAGVFIGLVSFVSGLIAALILVFKLLVAKIKSSS